MKKYIIKSSVPLDTVESSLWKSVGKHIVRYTMGKNTFPYGFANAFEVYPIKTLNELSLFSNYQNKRWAYDTVYIEHPLVRYLLISEHDFKDVLLREIVADISNYILDHISVSELVFGVVKSHGFEASIPINEISSDAKIKCKLIKSYYHHVKNTTCTHQNQSYIWIDSFPEIKSAVEHQAEAMENIVRSSFDFLGEDSNIWGIKLTRNLSFYISYKK